MNRLALLFTLALLASSAQARPNVLVILADDMGYSDPGCFGGEIQTPVLDGLAKNGLRFTQFYNTARCWPTRAALLTGYYPQQVGRDGTIGIRGGSGGRRPRWAKLLPAYLKSAGYRSYHAGKWHVDSTPLATGFDKSYRVNDDNRFFHPNDHLLDDKPLPAIKPGGDFYSTTAIATRAINQLRDHHKNHADKPFFAYVAFLSPHFPLMAPKADIAAVGSRYDVGWDVIRQQRWKRLQKLGLLPQTAKLSAIEPKTGSPYPHWVKQAQKKLGPQEIAFPVPWATLTAAQKKFQAKKMAIHAAMVERNDKEIGRLVEQLRAMGALEDTLILFLSDNGASAEIMIRGDGHDPQAPMGSAKSYLCLGPPWSTVANTPFRKHKSWVHEGGAATPLIAHWPKGIPADQAGTLRQTVGHVVDIVPTVLELAGATDAIAAIRKNPAPLPGKSLVPALEKEVVRDGAIWFSHNGNHAIRVGDFKAVRHNRSKQWELYNLQVDRSETNDLAKKHPKTLQKLVTQWNAITKKFQHVTPTPKKSKPH